MGDVMETLEVPAHVPADRVLDFDIYMDPAMSCDPYAQVARMRAEAVALASSARRWRLAPRAFAGRVKSPFSAPAVSGKATRFSEKAVPLAPVGEHVNSSAKSA